MALNGLHVAAGYAGSYRRDKSQPILGKIIWSEAPASGAATTNVAPAFSDVFGQPVFRFRSSADVYVSIGPAPNPAASPRILVPAGTDYDVFAEPGDKVAWSAA
jgi:hypothetical protein